MTVLGGDHGIWLSLLIGPDPVAVPAELGTMEAFLEMEIAHSDAGPSGFRLAFGIGRSGPLDPSESPLVSDPRLDVDSRVVVTTIVDATPFAILDGVITERRVRPGDSAGDGELTLLGRDLSWQLDKEVKQVEHSAMDEVAIATSIAGGYPEYGFTPAIIPPAVIDPPSPSEWTPQQNCTDWAYLKKMAFRHGYEVHIDPGPIPGKNTLYWGPPITPGLPQKAISVDLGPSTNAFDVDVGHSAEELTTVEGLVQDRQTGKTVPVTAPLPSRPQLGLTPEAVRRRGRLRKRPIPTSGLTAAQASARALGVVDDSAADVGKVTGTLDTLRYNGLLRTRSLVDLRGVGLSFDGTYKVREVRHKIAPGSYTQDFTLTRSELGSKSPVVRVA